MHLIRRTRTQHLRVSALVWLLPLFVTQAFGQTKFDLSRVVGLDADSLRRVFVIQPHRVSAYLSRFQTADASRIAMWTGLHPDAERILKLLDAAYAEKYGARFLADNPFVIELVDSLRLAYYSDPLSYEADRLDHLEVVSRAASGQSFAQASPVLMRLLNHDRSAYFQKPDSFAEDRLKALDAISLRVASLPFLRGSPDLVASLERARLEHEEAEGGLPAERLRRLDTVSLRVTGEPFIVKSNVGVTLALAVSSTGLIVAVFILVTRQRRRGRNPFVQRRARPSRPMTVAEACRVLLVEPDVDLEKLNQAYRTQQKKYHPDVVAHLGAEFQRVAEERTRSINEAYELLKNRVESTT